MTNHSGLIDFYRAYGDSTFAVEEPAYAEVCRRLGDYPQLVELLAAHDPEAQQPNLLFAAVRYLLLAGLDHPLGQIYAGVSEASASAVFADFVIEHRPAIDHLLANRRTQTNEVGRCAVIAVMLADAQRRAGGPLGWIDLGASGGLNLNIDQFCINYRIDDSTATTGNSNSPVQLTCDVRSGAPPVAPDHATIGWRIGIDRAPVDVTDPDQARWLQACLWPSKTGRQDRLDAAIRVAEERPPAILHADAEHGLIRALSDAPHDVTLVMTSTWVWYYLPQSTKNRVLELLDASQRRVLWYSLEGQGVVRELGLEERREAIDSVIGLVELGANTTSHAEVLGMAHAHGDWLEWTGHS